MPVTIKEPTPNAYRLPPHLIQTSRLRHPPGKMTWEARSDEAEVPKGNVAEMAEARAAQGENSPRAFSSLPGMRGPTAKNKWHSVIKRNKRQNVSARCYIATWKM